MGAAKVAVTIDRDLLERLDALVERRVYASRSKAVQDAVADKLRSLDRARLAAECAKLDPVEERAMAEEGMATEMDAWPPY